MKITIVMKSGAKITQRFVANCDYAYNDKQLSRFALKLSRPGSLLVRLGLVSQVAVTSINLQSIDCIIKN